MRKVNLPSVNPTTAEGQAMIKFRELVREGNHRLGDVAMNAARYMAKIFIQELAEYVEEGGSCEISLAYKREREGDSFCDYITVSTPDCEDECIFIREFVALDQKAWYYDRMVKAIKEAFTEILGTPKNGTCICGGRRKTWTFTAIA